MVEIMVMATSASMGMLFLILKFGTLRRILAFDLGIDIATTALLMWSMSGTYTGIMVAIIAGGMLSAALFVLKKMFPPDTLTPKGWVKSTDTRCSDWIARRTNDTLRRRTPRRRPSGRT